MRRGSSGPVVAVLAAAALVTALVVALVVGGSTGARADGRAPRAVVVAAARVPTSFDVSSAVSLPELEAATAAHTPLLVHRPGSGRARRGDRADALVPALAAALPTTSADGTVVSVRLRAHLRYSDGTPVRAGDVAVAVERTLRLHGRGAPLLRAHLVGAAAFTAGSAGSVAGVRADDAQRTVSFTLTAPWGSFAELLALPTTSPLPSRTPLVEQPVDPPPGVGPDALADLVPGVSYALHRVAGYAGLHVAAVPAARSARVRVVAQVDATTAVETVLTGRADVLDPAAGVPGGLRAQVRARAGGRSTVVASAATTVLLLDASRAPFDRPAVRRGLRDALDRSALARLAQGAQLPACALAPSTRRSTGRAGCSSGRSAGLRRAVAAAHLRAAAVVVAGPASGAGEQQAAAVVAALDRAGLRARLALPSPPAPGTSGASGAATASARSTGRRPQAAVVTLDPALPDPASTWTALRRSLAEQLGAHLPAAERAQLALLGRADASSSPAGPWRALARRERHRAAVVVLTVGALPRLTAPHDPAVRAVVTGDDGLLLSRLGRG